MSPYAKLSGGQRRQAQFAIAVCGRPRLLFLDEPTVGLDVQAREIMWASIRKLVSQGCAIVLTTHYLEEAEQLAKHVAIIRKGEIVASGTMDEILAMHDDSAGKEGYRGGRLEEVFLKLTSEKS